MAVIPPPLWVSEKKQIILSEDNFIIEIKSYVKL